MLAVSYSNIDINSLAIHYLCVLLDFKPNYKKEAYILLVSCLEREGFYLENKEIALYEIWLKKGLVAFDGHFLSAANLLGRLELMKQDKI